MNRVASQPHIQALSPSLADKENHNQQVQQTPPVPIKSNKKSRAFHSPIPSPSDHNYGTSIPKSLERPKSIILTMGAIKSKNARIGEPVELSLITATDKQVSHDDQDPYNKGALDDISSGMFTN